MINLDKILNWALSAKVEDLKWLDASITDVTNEMDYCKHALKKLKDKRAQLTIARDLNLTHLGPKLSVQCDGKTISVNCLKGQFNDAEKIQLRHMDFRWSKDKLDYVRLAKDVQIDTLREFINCYESVVDQ